MLPRNVGIKECMPPPRPFVGRDAGRSVPLCGRGGGIPYASHLEQVKEPVCCTIDGFRNIFRISQVLDVEKLYVALGLGIRDCSSIPPSLESECKNSAHEFPGCCASERSAAKVVLSNI